jgi:hypothetical protein
MTIVRSRHLSFILAFFTPIAESVNKGSQGQSSDGPAGPGNEGPGACCGPKGYVFFFFSVRGEENH